MYYPSETRQVSGYMTVGYPTGRLLELQGLVYLEEISTPFGTHLNSLIEVIRRWRDVGELSCLLSFRNTYSNRSSLA